MDKSKDTNIPRWLDLWQDINENRGNIQEMHAAIS